MSQNYSTNCYDVSHTVDMDMTQIEGNCEALRTNHSGGSAPSNPIDYMLWADTANLVLKTRYSSAWYAIWNYSGDCVPDGKVKTASLATGVLTADATGRGKMADSFITNAKVNDVDGSKITDNTITSAKIQNNAITPSKAAAGFGSLCSFVPGPIEGNSYDSTITEDNFVTITNVTSAQTLARFYIYIPTGAKYIIVAGRGYAAGGAGTGYARINVGGTTGSQVSFSGSIGYAYGSSLDISGLAGAWREVKFEVWHGTGATLYIYSLYAQWYGA